jgi:hypothetical protein
MSLLKPVSLAAFLLGAFSLPASAIERVNTNKISCAKVQTRLIQNGAAILRYPSKRKAGLTLYDRYVGDSRFCPSNEIGKWASVPAKDTGTCRVIACERYEPNDLFPFERRFRPFLRIRISN